MRGRVRDGTGGMEARLQSKIIDLILTVYNIREQLILTKVVFLQPFELQPIQDPPNSELNDVHWLLNWKVSALLQSAR